MNKFTCSLIFLWKKALKKKNITPNKNIGFEFQKPYAKLCGLIKVNQLKTIIAFSILRRANSNDTGISKFNRMSRNYKSYLILQSSILPLLFFNFISTFRDTICSE